jgi:antitoxin (DNA-binding transcriptional repressor) of toxin-antitoxin stability system
LLNRVEAGETLTITVDGRPMALLSPIGRRPRWLDRSEFVTTVLTRQADAGLTTDLVELAGEMTDEHQIQ